MTTAAPVEVETTPPPVEENTESDIGEGGPIMPESGGKCVDSVDATQGRDRRASAPHTVGAGQQPHMWCHVV